MDQTVLGIIIVITIWVLSAIANRKKKAASGRQQTAKQQLKFDTRTGKRIRFDTRTGQPLFDSTEHSEMEEQEEPDPIDAYLAAMNERREQSSVLFEVEEPEEEHNTLMEEAEASIEAARLEREEIERRIRAIRAKTSSSRADAAERQEGLDSGASLPAMGLASRGELVQAIVFAEILSKPKSRRRGQRI